MKITPEIVVQQYEIDSRDDKRYIDDFILDIPEEVRPYAKSSVGLLLDLYTKSPDNNVDSTQLIQSNIPECKYSEKIKSGVIELDRYLKNYTWKKRQADMKNHFDQFICTLSSSSPAQLLQAKQV